jgi:hypothetical protein
MNVGVHRLSTSIHDLGGNGPGTAEPAISAISAVASDSVTSSGTKANVKRS